MRICAVLVSCVLTGLAPLSAARRAAESYVTVIDGERRPVRGLSEEDFALRDGGTRQHVLDVVPADAPLAIAVVIVGFEASELSDAQAAVAAGRQQLQTIDSRHRIDVVEPARPSPVDAVIEAGQSLRAVLTDRRVVLAMLRRQRGDGAGTQTSRLSDTILQERLALWTVEVGPSQTTGLDKVLADTTALGGALRESVATTSAIKAAVTRVVDLLTSQYVVSYQWPDPMLSEFNLTIRHERGTVLTPAWQR